MGELSSEGYECEPRASVLEGARRLGASVSACAALQATGPSGGCRPGSGASARKPRVESLPSPRTVFFRGFCAFRCSGPALVRHRIERRRARVLALFPGIPRWPDGGYTESTPHGTDAGGDRHRASNHSREDPDESLPSRPRRIASTRSDRTTRSTSSSVRRMASGARGETPVPQRSGSRMRAPRSAGSDPTAGSRPFSAAPIFPGFPCPCRRPSWPPPICATGRR